MSTSGDPWGDQRRPLPPELDPRRGQPAGPPHGRPPRQPSYGQPNGPSYRRGGGEPPIPPDGGWPPRRRGRGASVLAGLRIAAAVLSVLVLVASGFMWFLYRDFTGKVGRVNAIGRTVDDVDGRDQNILLVGSDDRTNATAKELQELSTTLQTTNSTDTMILVHVPADGRTATAVSFPRDSYVEIPGFGRKKLNSAYINGATNGGQTKPNPDRGRQLLVQTISELSGLKIDHYVEVDLLGFYRITKAIGGVEVCLRSAQKEKDSGIDLPAGKSVIEGKQALSFVRQRKGLPNGDLDRIVRQQYFLGATFRKMTSVGVLGNPIKLKRLLDAIGTSLRMDRNLDPLQLARQVRGLAAGNIQFKTVPNLGTAARNGQSVVLLDEQKLPAFFRSISSPAPAKAPAKTVPRDQVTVDVFNGSGRGGLATSTATALRTAGFRVDSTGNADRRDYTRSEIRYEAGQEAAARTLAAAVPGATLVERSGTGGSVQLVIGSSFSGVKSASSGGGATSSAAPAAPAASGQPAQSRTAADANCVN